MLKEGYAGGGTHEAKFILGLPSTISTHPRSRSTYLAQVHHEGVDRLPSTLHRSRASCILASPFEHRTGMHMGYHVNQPYMSAYSIAFRRGHTSCPCAYALGGRVIERSAFLDLRVYLMPWLIMYGRE